MTATFIPAFTSLKGLVRKSIQENESNTIYMKTQDFQHQNCEIGMHH
jgi:hypothetical protein